ncbi:MAG: DNA-processing protein DprA [Deferribacteraceae bacterium]|nr:DNA-processing protein DprA [Deferribacteraceae bacterium]
MDTLLTTYIRLRQIKGVSEQTIRNLLSLRGTLAGLFDCTAHELFAMGVDLRTAHSIVDSDNHKYAEEELLKAHRIDGQIIPLESDDYPTILKEISDPPLLLYVIGDINCLKEFCIAVVGARKVSRNGVDVTRKIASDLASCGVTIVSGLAYGVDITAHTAALSVDGATVAVLGSGLNKIYPAEHLQYIKEICKKGCVISEYPMDEPPNPYNFPKRNRIVSGLSKGVLIAEASNRSGSLITCRLALEQGRDVFAVPISPLAANNATNYMIKNGAILTQSYLDILREFGLQLEERLSEPIFASEIERRIWEELGIEPLGADELVTRLDINSYKVMAAVAAMELENKVDKGNDGRYYRVLGVLNETVTITLYSFNVLCLRKL